MLGFGNPQLAWLKMLKNSERNCNFQRSVMAKFLNTEKLKFTKPGPTRLFRPAFPNEFTGALKAQRLYHAAEVRIFVGATQVLNHLDPEITMRGLVEIYRRNKTR